jgi:multidrug resistance protein, MATE family
LREDSVSPTSLLPHEQRALPELLALAVPTVLQHASYPVMQFIDTLMLAVYGRQEGGAMEIMVPTAAGNSGFFAFSVISLGVGVLWIVNTLVSQNFGNRNFRECGRYLWQGVWFSLVFGILALAVLPFSREIFEWFGHELALVELEAAYFRIVIGATVLKLLQTTAAQFCIAIQRPGIVLYATLCGIVVNLLANWLLIYGSLGFPRLGVVGAAWGTNLSVAVELVVLGVFIGRPVIRRTFHVLDWRFRRHEMGLLLKVGAPSGLQITTDVLAWALFSLWVMGLFGTTAMAANTFMMRYMAISFMPAFGISTAVTALVGKYIGMGRADLAVRRAHLGFIITAVYMLTCGVIFYVGRYRLIGLFTEDAEVLRIGAMLLIFAAGYQFADALYIGYNGALRGAGDTFVPAVVTAGLCWSMVLGLGYAVAKWWPELGVAGPWAVSMVYGVVLGIFILWRFRSGRWRRIHLTEGN